MKVASIVTKELTKTHNSQTGSTTTKFRVNRWTNWERGTKRTIERMIHERDSKTEIFKVYVLVKIDLHYYIKNVCRLESTYSYFILTQNIFST